MFMSKSNPAGKTPRSPRTGRATQPLFTLEEHLRLQRRIEERARQIWRAGGRRQGNPLSDWVQAEIETLAEFIATHTGCDPGRVVFGKAQIKMTRTFAAQQPNQCRKCNQMNQNENTAPQMAGNTL